MDEIVLCFGGMEISVLYFSQSIETNEVKAR